MPVIKESTKVWNSCPLCTVVQLLPRTLVGRAVVHSFINPRRTCAARVTVVVVCVCLSVSQSVTRHLTSRAINRSTNNATYSVLGIQVENYVGFSLKLLRSGVTAWNTIEKANMLIGTGLPWAGPLALCILKAQEVTTKGRHRLPHATYCCSSQCQTLRELLAWRTRVNAY